MSNILGSPFKKYVNEQIIARQKLFGKTKNNDGKVSTCNISHRYFNFSSASVLKY